MDKGSVTIVWQPPYSHRLAPVVYTSIEYNFTSPSQEQTGSVRTPAVHSTYTFSGIGENTLIKARVIAVNAVGPSTPSLWVNETTVPSKWGYLVDFVSNFTCVWNMSSLLKMSDEY